MPKKVVEVNLEYDMPTVEMAVQRLKNALTTHKRQGCKAVIVIHGYGSSGVGGSIKTAVQKCLGEKSMQGIVRAYTSGEQWHNKKRELTGMCKALLDYNSHLENNYGVTVVILK